MTILVIDVGTSGLRAAAVRPDASIAVEEHRPLLPSSPEPGLVEFDATVMATTALELARSVLAEAGPVDAVGITNQRASTIVWDRATGEPVGPGIGWQDLRTVGTCLVLQADGIHLAPNASATKVAYLLDLADPDRTRDLCVGTVDTWLAWHLSEGAIHATDASNAAVTGMMTGDASGWQDKILDALRIPVSTPAAGGRHVRDPRSGHRPGRSAAHRSAGRRPAVQPRGTGLRLPRHGEDHLRHGRHARPAPRRGAAPLRAPGRRRLLPDRRVASRRGDRLGRRGGHAVRGHERGVAPRRPRHHRHGGGQP